MRVASVYAGVLGNKSATKILPFESVNDARNRDEHFVCMNFLILIRHLILTSGSGGGDIDRPFLRSIELTDLFSPLVTLPFPISLIGSHTPIKAEIIAMGEEEITATQPIVSICESSGERFTVHSSPTILKIIRISDVTIVSQATIFISNEIQIADVCEGLVTIRTIAAKKAIG